MLETHVPVQELKQLYTLRKWDEVVSYIGENSFLIPLLKAAPKQIKTYFPNVPLFLELFIDPDNLRDRYLIIWIGTQFSVDETLDKLYKLEESVWESIFVASNDKISFNIKYV
jgi:hypothetical protein